MELISQIDRPFGGYLMGIVWIWLPVTTAPPESFGLPAGALDGLGTRPFGVYVHVPFCAVRCGYCDFNTYTPSELAGSGASPAGWLDALRRRAGPRGVGTGRRVGVGAAAETVFVGGRHPVAAGRGRVGRRAGRGPKLVRAGRRRRGDDRVQPRVHLAGVLRRHRRGRLHAGVARHAVRRARVLAVLDRRHTRGARSPPPGRRAPAGSGRSAWT